MMGEAILVSASNPKSVLFLSALFPQFLDAEAAILPQFALMFGTIICIVSLIHMIYARVAGHLRDRLTARRRKMMSQGAGLGSIGLGGGLLITK